MKNMVTGPKGHSTVRSVWRSAVTHGAAVAILATGLTVVASTSASAVLTTPLSDPTLHTGVGAQATTNASFDSGAQSPTSAATDAGRSPLVPQVAQVAQSALTLASTRGVVGTALTLTSSGGSGAGGVTFAVTSTRTAGCFITSAKLNATRAGTGTVTVTKAGDSTCQVARSPATTFVFHVNVVPVILTAARVNGFVWVGRTSIVTITGAGFYSTPTIRSNQARTTADVIHDDGRALVVRVRLAPGSAQGWHVFTITLANGHSWRVRNMVKW